MSRRGDAAAIAPALEQPARRLHERLHAHVRGGSPRASRAARPRGPRPPAPRPSARRPSRSAARCAATSSAHVVGEPRRCRSRSRAPPPSAGERAAVEQLGHEVARASSFAAGATESSRSITTSSAGSAPPWRASRSDEPGTDRQDRRALMANTNGRTRQWRQQFLHRTRRRCWKTRSRSVPSRGDRRCGLVLPGGARRGRRGPGARQPAPAGDAAGGLLARVGRRSQHRRVRASRPRRPRSATCAPGGSTGGCSRWMAPPSVVGALAGGYLAGEISESGAAARDRGRAPLQRRRPAALGAPGAARGRRPRSEPAARHPRGRAQRARDRAAGRPRGADPRRAADARAARSWSARCPSRAVGTNLTVGVLVGVAGLLGHLPDGRARLGPARARRGGVGAGRAAGRAAHRHGSRSASSCGPSAWRCSWRARPRRCRPWLSGEPRGSGLPVQDPHALGLRGSDRSPSARGRIRTILQQKLRLAGKNHDRTTPFNSAESPVLRDR